MLKQTTTILITFALISGCSDDAPESKAPPKMSFTAPSGSSWTPEEADQVKQALGKLNSQCAPLAAYWADVENAEASLRDTVSDHLKAKGWNKNVYAQVRFKQNPEVTPRSYQIQGHTCHFDIGIEGEIGLSVAKKPCQKICAMTQDQMVNKFAALDKLVILADAPEEKNILRTKEIEKQFSAWDGSHRNLEHLVEANLNDPGSYEHDQTRYWDMGDHLIVGMSYRANNAYGALVKGYVKAKVDLDGNILEILDSW